MRRKDYFDVMSCWACGGNPHYLDFLNMPTGEGTGNPLQCSCLENPMDRKAWRATVHGDTKSQTRLSD